MKKRGIALLVGVLLLIGGLVWSVLAAPRPLTREECATAFVDQLSRWENAEPFTQLQGYYMGLEQENGQPVSPRWDILYRDYFAQSVTPDCFVKMIGEREFTSYSRLFHKDITGRKSLDCTYTEEQDLVGAIQSLITAEARYQTADGREILDRRSYRLYLEEFDGAWKIARYQLVAQDMPVEVSPAA